MPAPERRKELLTVLGANLFLRPAWYLQCLAMVWTTRSTVSILENCKVLADKVAKGHKIDR